MFIINTLVHRTQSAVVAVPIRRSPRAVIHGCIIEGGYSFRRFRTFVHKSQNN